MYRQGTNPFCTSTREFFISLYVFLTVTSFVVCLSECSIYSIVLKSRARNLYAQKYEFISIINTFCSLFYIILSKNVGICNT